MAKFCGVLGFSITEETKPGVWVQHVTEHTVYGDLLKNSFRNEKSENLNDNFSVNHQVSILMDPYVMKNFSMLKYVKFMDTAWKVNSFEMQYPRLILTLGGVYNVQ